MNEDLDRKVLLAAAAVMDILPGPLRNNTGRMQSAMGQLRAVLNHPAMHSSNDPAARARLSVLGNTLLLGTNYLLGDRAPELDQGV